MPWKSDAQRRWGNSPSGHKALGDRGVNEWNAASKGKKLPEKVSSKSLHKRSMSSKMKNGQVSERARSRMYGGKDDNNIPGSTA